MRQNTKSTYAIDIDGILCEEREFGYLDYLHAQPIQNNIKKVNYLYDKRHVIFLYTSRLEEDRGVTEQWLRENKVKYNVLVMNKLRADYYIDNCNLDINDLK